MFGMLLCAYEYVRTFIRGTAIYPEKLLSESGGIFLCAPYYQTRKNSLLGEERKSKRYDLAVFIRNRWNPV